MRAMLLFSLLGLSLLCVAHNARAQIHRCMGAQGEPVFTDQPCGAAELSVGVASSTTDSELPTESHAAGINHGAQLAASCPRSPQQVRDRIAVAFSDDNPNALAGLFDWRGFDHDSADARLREFRRWLKRPLAGVQFSGAPDPSGAQPGDADYDVQAPSGVTVLTQSGGNAEGATPDARSFGMANRGGCWWLMF
ncbi:MAG TPA: hypothetical protein VN725_00030 [Rhodanobacteraceae bacterium]|nr:hypothetical protein [Rhodanobacteraceae bacterium]